MTVSTYQLLRDDGTPIPAFRAPPATRDSAVRAALSVMVAEAAGPFSHRLLFVMADGSRVVAKPRISQ
jgi:hypothetical protein